MLRGWASWRPTSVWCCTNSRHAPRRLRRRSSKRPAPPRSTSVSCAAHPRPLEKSDDRRTAVLGFALEHHSLDLLVLVAGVAALRPCRAGFRTRHPSYRCRPGGGYSAAHRRRGKSSVLLMGFAAALVGIFATGHEYRYGTILPTLTAMPRRSALLAAKLLVVVGASAVAAVAVIAICWLVGTVTLGEPLPLVQGPSRP